MGKFCEGEHLFMQFVLIVQCVHAFMRACVCVCVCVCVVWRVHHGTFGPKLGNQIRAFSMVGPHSGTDLGDLAKIIPGTIRIILIPCTKKTHFGQENTF